MSISSWARDAKKFTSPILSNGGRSRTETGLLDGKWNGGRQEGPGPYVAGLSGTCRSYECEGAGYLQWFGM